MKKGKADPKLGLKAHNLLRKIHGSPELKLNDEMNKEAQAYAEKLAEKGELEHEQNLEEGENLARGCDFDGKEMSAEEATRMW